LQKLIPWDEQLIFRVWSRTHISLAEIKQWSVGDLVSASAQLRIDDLIDQANMPEPPKGRK
jgi:hypothetical protein